MLSGFFFFLNERLRKLYLFVKFVIYRIFFVPVVRLGKLFQGKINEDLLQQVTARIYSIILYFPPNRLFCLFSFLCEKTNSKTAKSIKRHTINICIYFFFFSFVYFIYIHFLSSLLYSFYFLFIYFFYFILFLFLL